MSLFHSSSADTGMVAAIFHRRAPQGRSSKKQQGLNVYSLLSDTFNHVTLPTECVCVCMAKGTFSIQVCFFTLAFASSTVRNPLNYY